MSIMSAHVLAARQRFIEEISRAVGTSRDIAWLVMRTLPQTIKQLEAEIEKKRKNAGAGGHAT
jgi:hypothetical protein